MAKKIKKNTLVKVQNIRGNRINVHCQSLEVDEIREVPYTDEVEKLIFHKYLKIIEEE
jgi:hypothetical protein